MSLAEVPASGRELWPQCRTGGAALHGRSCCFCCCATAILFSRGEASRHVHHASDSSGFEAPSHPNGSTDTYLIRRLSDIDSLQQRWT